MLPAFTGSVPRFKKYHKKDERGRKKLQEIIKTTLQISDKVRNKDVRILKNKGKKTN